MALVLRLGLVCIPLGLWACTHNALTPAVAPAHTSSIGEAGPLENNGDEGSSVGAETTIDIALAPDFFGSTSGGEPEEDRSHLFELRFDVEASANIVLQACEFRDFGVPRETSIQGCLSAHCLNGRGGLSVCRCQEDDIETDSNWIRVTRGAALIAQWETWSDMLDSSSLTAASIDLDGDSVDELVVSGRENFLCGEGAEAFNVAIVELDEPGQRPLRFHSWEFDADAFVRAGPDGRCAILATDIFRAGFMDYRFIARPFFYRGEGYLVPAVNQPILEMSHQRVMNDRYTEEGHRSAGTQGPRSWFDHPDTRVLAEDPLLLGLVRGQLEVTIGSAADLDDRGGDVVALRLRLDGPGDMQMDYLYADIVDNEPDLPAVVVIGHAPTGRLFPFGYGPAGGPSYFQGRQGLLEARQSEMGSVHMLWLESSVVP